MGKFQLHVHNTFTKIIDKIPTMPDTDKEIRDDKEKAVSTWVRDKSK